MKSEIKVPSMGESISEASIGQMLAPAGSQVDEDAELLELETDKVNQVLYAPQAGRVEWSVRPGDVVRIGQTIGTIENGEGAEKALAAQPAAPPAEASPPPQAPLPPPVKERVESTPKEAAPAQETRSPLSPVRKVIAKRLVESLRSSAMLTTFNEVDMTPIIQIRKRYGELFAKKHGVKLGFMSFFVKATVAALQAFPTLNAYLDGEEVVQRGYFHLGVAVGTDKGVIVPVVQHCDRLSYAEIERAIADYAQRAREGKLSADHLQGGGFTITNGGLYGSLLSTPILLPPQCGILGMHKVEKRPVVIDEQVAIRSMMYVALSYDHRLIDGREAVSFLVYLKERLEDPLRLALEI